MHRDTCTAYPRSRQPKVRLSAHSLQSFVPHTAHSLKSSTTFSFRQILLTSCLPALTIGKHSRVLLPVYSVIRFIPTSPQPWQPLRPAYVPCTRSDVCSYMQARVDSVIDCIANTYSLVHSVTSFVAVLATFENTTSSTFTMSLDGASDSKPTLEFDNEHTGLQKGDRKPTRLRRFMSIGSRGSNAPSKLRKNPGSDHTAPMQTLSPRPTEWEPWVKTQNNRSISTFLSKNSSNNGPQPTKNKDNVSSTQNHPPVTEVSSLSLPPAAIKGEARSVEGQGHLPVTGDPYQPVQMQPRKDSATKSFYNMPTAASRTAALTSHPVGKEDLESEEELQTPRESLGVPGGRLRGKVTAP
jgi:hypothetical protein